MERRRHRARRLLRVVGIVTAVALALVPASSESGTDSRLFAFVVPTNRGPLPACSPDGSDCTGANRLWNFIYVTNANRPTDFAPASTSRAELPDAFAVSSIDAAIFVNGVHVPAFDHTVTPPPNAIFRTWSGHWPSTVTCPQDPGPCNVVGSPAVVPGENAAIVYAGWVHVSNEPNGVHVFKYTVHGTLNGAGVDLTAISPPIRMTD